MHCAPVSASDSEAGSVISPRTKSARTSLSLARAASGLRLMTRTVSTGIAASRRTIARPMKPEPPAIAMTFGSMYASMSGDRLRLAPARREAIAREKLAATRVRHGVAIFKNHPAARNRFARPAGHLEAFEGIVVGA